MASAKIMDIISVKIREVARMTTVLARIAFPQPPSPIGLVIQWSKKLQIGLTKAKKKS